MVLEGGSRQKLSLGLFRGNSLPAQVFLPGFLGAGVFLRRGRLIIVRGFHQGLYHGIAHVAQVLQKAPGRVQLTFGQFVYEAVQVFFVGHGY